MIATPPAHLQVGSLAQQRRSDKFMWPAETPRGHELWYGLVTASGIGSLGLILGIPVRIPLGYLAILQLVGGTSQWTAE